jgi:hypothetical protein
MKKIYNLLIALLFVSSSFTMSYGQLIFKESFDYPLGNLQGNGGWSNVTTTNTPSSNNAANIIASTFGEGGNAIKIDHEAGLKAFYDKSFGQTILGDADPNGTVYWIGFWYNGTNFGTAGAAQIVLVGATNYNVDLSTSGAAEGARNMRLAFGKTPTFGSATGGMAVFTRAAPNGCGAQNWPAAVGTTPKAPNTKYYVLIKIVKGGTEINFTAPVTSTDRTDDIRVWHLATRPTVEPTGDGDFGVINTRMLRDLGVGGVGTTDDNSGNPSASLGCRVTGGGVTGIRLRLEGAAAGSSAEFDDIRIAKGALNLDLVLSAELTNFTASKNGQSNLLKWTTASEKNNKGFHIERSNDATNWKTIGYQKGAGESNDKLTYNFVDEGPLSISYYRLRQEDFDGRETVSKVISVEQKGKLNVLLTPNPTKDVLNINIQNDVKNVDVAVYDMVGRSVLTSTFNGGQSALNVSNLTNGMYMIHIQSEGKTTIQKFIKD